MKSPEATTKGRTAKQATEALDLESRIRALRGEIEALIDAKAKAVASESPGVPIGVIRNLITARAPNCACAQYLEISGKE